MGKGGTCSQMFRKRPTVTLPRVLNVGFVFGNPTFKVFCFPYVKLPTPFALEDVDHIFGNTSEWSPVFPQIFKCAMSKIDGLLQARRVPPSQTGSSKPDGILQDRWAPPSQASSSKPDGILQDR